MLQSVTTLGSLLITAGMLVTIAAILADDWRAVTRALGFRRPFEVSALPARGRPSADRRVRIVSVSSQSAPRSAAA